MWRCVQGRLELFPVALNVGRERGGVAAHRRSGLAALAMVHLLRQDSAFAPCEGVDVAIAEEHSMGIRGHARRFGGLALFVVAASAAVSAPVLADQTFHTERIALESVIGAPLQSGFVIDIHANGPEIYAHERYVLNGAAPNTTYQVSVLIYAFDPTCATTPIVIPEATLVTNSTGNGTAEKFFAPSDVPPALRGATHGLVWQVSSGGEVVYQTACTPVALD